MHLFICWYSYFLDNKFYHFPIKPDPVGHMRGHMRVDIWKYNAVARNWISMNAVSQKHLIVWGYTEITGTAITGVEPWDSRAVLRLPDLQQLRQRLPVPVPRRQDARELFKRLLDWRHLPPIAPISTGSSAKPNHRLFTIYFVRDFCFCSKWITSNDCWAGAVRPKLSLFIR